MAYRQLGRLTRDIIVKSSHFIFIYDTLSTTAVSTFLYFAKFRKFLRLAEIYLRCMRILCGQVYFILARSFAPATFTTGAASSNGTEISAAQFVFLQPLAHPRVRACVRACERREWKLHGEREKNCASIEFYIARADPVNGMLTFEFVRRLSRAAHDKNDSYIRAPQDITLRECLRECREWSIFMHLKMQNRVVVAVLLREQFFKSPRTSALIPPRFTRNKLRVTDR